MSVNSITCSNDQIKYFPRLPLCVSLSVCVFFSPTSSIPRRGILLGKTLQGWVSAQPVSYRPGSSQHGKLWSKHQQVPVVRSVFKKQSFLNFEQSLCARKSVNRELCFVPFRLFLPLICFLRPHRWNKTRKIQCCQNKIPYIESADKHFRRLWRLLKQ